MVISWEAEIRLQMLALLEELIRGGSQNWECGTYITAASKDIIEGIFLPNLVWRSGKVESTIRKVALAGCYGMLKAGATPTETLFAVAPSLVPLLTSALDDTYSDGSQSRFMACIGLSVMFERLRGSFGDQSVREIYPQLLKRLDDSDDTVRIAICGTLGAFFLAAKPAEFAGTPIDYSLDQLFIHLDDSNTDMQEAVAKVLIESASTVDRALVLRKAEQSKLSHRSPHLCDKVIAAVNARQ